MDEIKRLQQLAGILTEIKVNNPNEKRLSREEFEDLREKVEEEFLNYEENISAEEEDDYWSYMDKVKESDTIKELEDALLWLYSGDQVNVDETINNIIEDLNEIKVNQPLSPELQTEFNFWTKLHAEEGLDNLYSGTGEGEYRDESELTNQEINDFRDKIKPNYSQEDEHYIWYNNSDELNGYSKLSGGIIDREGNGLNEDVSDFNIGQSSNTGSRKTTVTDIDPETQSVTWSVKKEVDNDTIHKDLSDLITKFEKVQLIDFHSRPKLIQLVKDLKTIRNKFSRTVVKEDLRILKENLVGILNEIKVNNPNKLDLSYDDFFQLLRSGWSGSNDDKVDDLLDQFGFPSFHLTDEEDKIKWWENLDNQDKQNLISSLYKIISNG